MAKLGSVSDSPSESTILSNAIPMAVTPNDIPHKKIDFSNQNEVNTFDPKRIKRNIDKITPTINSITKGKANCITTDTLIEAIPNITIRSAKIPHTLFIN